MGYPLNVRYFGKFHAQKIGILSPEYDLKAFGMQGTK